MSMMNWSPGPGAGPQGAIVVNTPSQDTLLREIETCLGEGRGFTVATLNLDHVVKIRRDPAFRSAYAQHSHLVADGNPIVWLTRLARQRVSLVPGSGLVDPVAALAARQGVPVALVGGTETSLAQASEALEKRHPELRIVARIAPPMGFDPQGAEAEATIDAIRISGARLCFLALGAPRQEVFAIRAQRQLPHAGFLSIGAGLDFIAGTQVRAPAWVRAVAAEWLWRLGSNPRRLAGRYAACLILLPHLVGRALKSRRGPSLRAPQATTDEGGPLG